MRITKGLTWPFLALALATTIVYMAGLAALQRTCYSQPLGGDVGNVATLATTSAFGMSADFGNCAKVFRFYWFVFAFVIATLIGLLVTVATQFGLHHSRPFWVGMLTISTLLMMIASETFLGFTKLFEGTGTWWLAQMRTTAAGAIMAVASLILLLMAVGTDWEGRRGGTRHGDDKLPATTGGTTGVAVPVQNVRQVEQV